MVLIWSYVPFACLMILAVERVSEQFNIFGAVGRCRRRSIFIAEQLTMKMDIVNDNAAVCGYSDPKDVHSS